MAWVAFLLGVVFSLLGWRETDSQSLRLAESRLQTRANELHYALQGALTANAQALRSARAYLAEHHRIGVQIEIDDFGTGHSSQTYLKQLPGHARVPFRLSPSMNLNGSSLTT